VTDTGAGRSIRAARKKESEMNEETGASRRPARPRRAAAVAILAGTALLAAACGGSPPAGSSTSPGQRSVQKAAVFAQCMRSHGEPNFYISGAGSSPGSTHQVRILGYTVAGIDPNSAQFAAAMTACRHLLPATAGTVARQHLKGELKLAACMRAHGYPAYPDPKMQPGGEWQALPAGIDTSSPQFQAAEKACGTGGGGG
jgi:hypothetical protein